MTVEYETKNPPAPPAKIEELEQRVGRTLPDDYRHYLLEQDGGYIAETNNEALEEIFSVAQAEPDYSRIWAYLGHMTDGSLPGGLLPVASDSGGNYFCVSLRDDDRGSVWFVHHEAEVDEDGTVTPIEVTRKADSWTAFLDSLQPEDSHGIHHGG